MKKQFFIIAALGLLLSLTGFGQTPGRLVGSKTHIKFFSSTPAENIEANNFSSTSTINKVTGEVVFSVPMQGFEFEKALMQKHFNNKDFLDTSTHPRARFKGKITNFEEIDFTKDGSYKANVEGEMSIKEETKPLKETGTIIVKGQTVEIQSKFNLTLADYGVTFVKGKPSTNIAKTVEVTFHGEYKNE